MGATLTGTRISDTYDSLLKATDNGIITSSAKQITDGVGTNTPLYISTTRIGIGVSPTTTFQVAGNSKIGGDLTVTGDLLVEGTTTTVDTDTLSVKDPLIIVGNDNNTSDLVDLGFYGLYDTSGSQDLYAGLYRSASTTKFHLFKDLQEEPTTTVNTSGTGYTKADLVIGNLETTQIDLQDNQKIRIGVSQDLEIYHNATNSFIDNDTGSLYIRNNAIDESINIQCDANGSLANYITAEGLTGEVTLYWNGSTKLVTKSNGIAVTGIISNLTDPSAAQDAATKNYVDTQISANNELSEVLANGNTTGGTDIAVSAGDDITFTDTSKSIYGTDGELEIHHNGNNSYITEDGTGALYLQGTYMYLTKSDGSQNYIELDLDGATDSRVKLNYGGATKLTTTSTGVDITGNINLGDNNKILLGVGDDLEIYSDGTDNYITQSSGTDLIFTIDSTEMMRIQSGGDISISESNPGNASRFYVKGFGYSTNAWAVGTSTGTFVGQITSSGGKLQIKSEENNDIQIGDATSLNIIHIDTSEDSVGIGLTNPADYSADELVINVPDDSGMTLVSAATDTAYIRFADGTTAADQANFISHDHNTNTLTIFSQAKVSIGILEAEVAYFTDTAFFVDKSTTIDDTLTVNGNSTFAGEVTISQETQYLNFKKTSTADVLVSMVSETDAGSGGKLRILTKRNGDTAVNALTIDDNQNVGIGTDSPFEDLEIYRDNSSPTLLVKAAGQTSSTTPTASLFLSPGSFSSNATAPRIIGYRTADFSSAAARSAGLKFGVAQNNVAKDAMWITEAQKVGIGTDSPDHILCIEDTEPTFRIFDAANTLNQEQTISFGTEPGNRTHAEISGVNLNTGNAEGGLIFKTNSGSSLTERMRIDSSGTIISSKDGAGLQTNLLLSNLNDTNGDATGIGFSMLNNNTYVKAGIFFERTTTQGRGSLIFATNNEVNGNNVTLSDERMRIDSSGRVGIGTTALSETLQVNGNIRVEGVGNVIGFDTTGALLSNGIKTINDYETLIYNGRGASGFAVIGNSNIRLGFGTNYTNAETDLFIDSSGNVGIGATSPDFALDIEALDSGVQLQIGRTNTSAGSTWMGSDSNGFHLGVGAYGAGNSVTDPNGFTVDTSGNVGIGKTSASLETNGFFLLAGNNSYAEFVRTTTSDASSNIYISRGNSGNVITFYRNDLDVSVGSISVTTNATSYNSGSSDKRLKKNITNWNENILDKFKDIKPKEFHFNNQDNTEEKIKGYIAQNEVDKFPEAYPLVYNEEAKEDRHLFNPSGMTVYLMKAIQELKAEVDLLKTQINN